MYLTDSLVSLSFAENVKKYNENIEAQMRSQFSKPINQGRALLQSFKCSGETRHFEKNELQLRRGTSALLFFPARDSPTLKRWQTGLRHLETRVFLESSLFRACSIELSSWNTGTLREIRECVSARMIELHEAPSLKHRFGKTEFLKMTIFHFSLSTGPLN